MPPEADPRKRTQRVPVLMNGVSNQPASSRLPNQVADATNFGFSVVDGATRRPGFWVQQMLTSGLLPAANNRMHKIVRDQDERYLVVHNRTSIATTIRILEISTNRWATVTISSDAQTYLDSASPGEFRFRTLIDYTLIVNTDQEVAATESEGTITAISAANPTVVTSSAAHGLTTGDTVVISGSNSTPSLDGAHVITSTGANTFTVPVNVTVAGTTGTWNNGKLTATTMPVKLVRQNSGSSGVITGISTANPAVVTDVAHGLVTGQTIEITGSNSTPTIDGTRVVTVLTADTFSVPVDTSAGVAGTAGTWTSQAYFTIDLVTWDQRASGDDETNPIRAFWDEGLKIADLRYWRGRLWIFGGSRATSTQAGDLFNFWIEDVNVQGDADPIDVPVASEEATDLNFAVPIRDSMILFAESGKQYELASPDILTPSSVKAKPLTAYRVLDCEPKVMDPALYFASKAGCNVQLLEYVYDEIALPSKADDVSAHVPDLMPLEVDVPGIFGSVEADESQLRTIEVSPEHGMVVLLRRDKVVDGEVFGTTLFVYRSHYLNGTKVQSAWTRWEVAQNGATRGIRGIHDCAVIGPYLYLLVHCGTDSPPDFFILRASLHAETECDEAPTGVEE